MGLEVRVVAPDEREAFALAVGRAFLDVRVEEHPDPDPDPSRCFVAVDEGETVGGCASYDFHLTMPGGDRVPVGGLTGMAVQATHQRRGAMRGLVDAHLDDCRSRGEAASVLMAAQATIYGRFGYGAATDTTGWRIDVRRGGFDRPAATGGSLRFLLQDDAADTLAGIYPRAVASRTGALDRPGRWFDAVLHRKESWMGGGDLFVVVHRNATGVDDGYVLYRVREPDEGDPGPVSAAIVELVAADPVVEAALWEFCLAIDPIDQVEYLWGPVDPAVLDWLADPRALTTTRRQDYLWIRPLDVPSLLGSRTYRVDGRLVFAIDDPADAAVHGRWEVVVDGGRAEVARSSAEPDLAMSVTSFGTLLLGGRSVGALARAGRIDGDPATIASADLMIGTERPPWCITKF